MATVRRRVNGLALCAGVGGLELGVDAALEVLGGRLHTVGYVEWESYAAAVLVARMADKALGRAPIWDDIRTFPGERYRGKVDLISGGFPCQPFSQAGTRLGLDDPRWLWPAFAKVVGEVGPSVVFLENVRGVAKGALEVVLGGLAALGFDAEWDLLAAGDVGAPHKRERWWLLAWRQDMAHGDRPRRPEIGRSTPSDEAEVGARAHGDHEPHRVREGMVNTSSVDEREPDHEERSESWARARQDLGRGSGTLGFFPPGPDDHDGWQEWIEAGGPQPGLRGDAHGVAARMDRLHAIGNGVVPLVAATAFVRLARRAGLVLGP